MENLQARVVAVVSGALKIPQDSVVLDMMVGDIPSWDSLGHALLLQAIEREFQLTFDIDEALEIESVKHLIVVLQRRLGVNDDRLAG